MTLQGTANVHEPGIEVDVGPLQAESFTLPKTETEADNPAGVDAVGSRGFEEAASFSGIQWSDLLSGHGRRVDQDHGVRLEQPPPDGDRQGPPQKRM